MASLFIGKDGYFATEEFVREESYKLDSVRLELCAFDMRIGGLPDGHSNDPAMRLTFEELWPFSNYLDVDAGIKCICEFLLTEEFTLRDDIPDQFYTDVRNALADPIESPASLRLRALLTEWSNKPETGQTG